MLLRSEAGKAFFITTDVYRPDLQAACFDG